MPYKPSAASTTTIADRSEDRVADNANDSLRTQGVVTLRRHPVRQAHCTTNRGFGVNEPAHECLVHDHGLFAGSRISVVEVSTGPKGQAVRREQTGRDPVRLREWLRLGRRSDAWF